jgi:hypothetical protein
MDSVQNCDTYINIPSSQTHKPVRQEIHALHEISGLFALLLHLDFHFVDTTLILSLRQYETERGTEE